MMRISTILIIGKIPSLLSTRRTCEKFAAMDPVVDLESLRGMKVKLVYNDEL